MFKKISDFFGSSLQTKILVITGVLFMLALVVTTLHSYGRLNYARSYKTNQQTEPPNTDDR